MKGKLMKETMSKLKNILSIKAIVPLFLSILQLSYLFILLRSSVSKLILFLLIVPIVLFNYSFIKYLEDKKLVFRSKKNKVWYHISIIVVSLLFCKSLSINIFNLSQGALSIPAGLGLIAFTWQLVIFITYILDKVSLITKTGHKKYSIFLYAVPSLIIFTLLYLIYFPGVRSIDSLVIWTDVGNNIYNDAHPIVYMLLVKFLRTLWNDIAVIALFNLLLSAFTFAFVVNELDKMGLPKWACWIAAIILPIFPANALYAVTLWKDIPYTMGLIVLCMLLLRCFTSDYYTKKSLPLLYFVSLFTLFMRHNAIFSVLLSLFIVGVTYIFKKDKKLIIKTLILGIALVVSYYGIKNIAIAALSSNDSGGEFTGKSLVYYTFPPTIAEQQLIYTEHVVGTSFIPEEREGFEVIFNVEGLKEHKEKYVENDIWMYYYIPTDTTYHQCSIEYFWDYYFKIYKRFPKSMLIGYQKITSIIWSSSNYGSVAYRGTVDDVNMEGLEPYEFRPVIKKFMDAKLFAHVFNYNDSSISAIFWRPAFMFMLSLVLLIVMIKKHGKDIWYVFLPVFLNQITYLIVIASQDTRYTYVNYTMFVIMFCLALIKPLKEVEEGKG